MYFLPTALVLYKTIDSIVALGLPHHDPVTSAVVEVISLYIEFATDKRQTPNDRRQPTTNYYIDWTKDSRDNLHFGK